MKFLRFIFSLLLTGGLIYFLNQNMGFVPPLGKLLDPFHGFWQNEEKDPLVLNMDLSLKDLQDEVKIQLEKNLVPHIFARNDHDLYFTQGYLTAYHRLWQMEFITLVASGRVSEVLGKMALNFDRLQRRKGLGDATEKSLTEIQNLSQAYSAITAYCEGVNAFINELDYGSLPIEYKLLDYVPEEWSPYKSMLIQKYLANDLNSNRDLMNTNLVQLFGKERFDFLFPDIPDDIDPIIPKGTKWDFKPIEIFSPDTFEITNSFSVYLKSLSAEGIGSNNWAITGSKTQNGSTILCNDPHLGLNLPMIWYAQQLKAPGINVYGVTIPGVPGIILGFNDSIAWGMTNADRDLQDWYQITFQDENCNEYLYGDKWLKTQKRIETIRIRGQEDFIDTVVYTHYGPVVYDRSFMGDSNLVNFALKWTVHNPSAEILSLYKLNRAHNLDATLEAIKIWDSPPQNFAVATRSGDIAQVVQGNYPLKWKEQGKFLMNGSDPKYEWQGYIPKEQNAKVINPERGFISSANQHPFTKDYPYYYYNSNEEHFRNKRINSILSDASDISVDDMKKLQNDNYFTLASESLPVMLDSLNEEELSEGQLHIVQLLKDWDYMADPYVVEPTYFHAWWIKMNKMLWDEFDVDIPVEWPSNHTTCIILNNYPSDSAFDILETKKTETINDILTASFIQSIDSVNAWISANDNAEPLWYKFKNTHLQHLARIIPFSYFQIPIGGYKGIVNATAENWGASWRMIVELGDEINAWGIYPGGQSGNPGSPAYNSYTEDWTKGEYFKIKFMGEFDEEGDGLVNILLTKEQEDE